MFERLKDCADRINDQLAGDARSRFNTIYLTSFLIGAAGGSSMAFAGAGWPGVCLAGAACAGVLLMLWLTVARSGF